MVEVQICCDFCGKHFCREKGEVNRAQKRGHQQYCSKECSYSGRESWVTNPDGNSDNLRSGSERDEYSPFRYFAKTIRRRHKSSRYKATTDIDLEFLQSLWQKQGGKCDLSGQKMYLPKSSTEWEGHELNPLTPSLGRIDNDKPYNRDYVRYVCYMANVCRNKFTDQDVIDFCEAVIGYHQET